MLAVFTVTTADDAGSGSLRDALAQADALAGVDQVVFDDALSGATITLTSSQLQINEAVSVDASALDALTIDAAGLDTTPGTPDGAGGRIFDVLANAAEFRGLTLLGGDVMGDGGAIRATGSLTIEDTTFQNNQAMRDGSAVAVKMNPGASNNDVTITNSEFLNNGNLSLDVVSTARGGAIFVGFPETGDGNDFSIAGSTLRGNGSDYDTGPEFSGGAAYFVGSGGRITMTNTTVVGNFARGGIGGGGIAGVLEGGFLTIHNSQIDNNTASSSGADGGGIFVQMTGGTLAVSESTISGNASEGNGGGVYAALDDTTMLLDLSQVEDNSAETAGGMQVVSDNGSEALIRRSAVFANEATSTGGLDLRADNTGSVIVSNSTVSENSSTGKGGGISALRAMANAVMRIDNSTICGNLISGEADVYGGGVYADSASYHVLINNSIVANNMVNGSGDDASGLVAANFSLFENTTAMSSVTGNFLIFNQDPMLGPLADNGGPTPTHYLLPGSPAIDTGSQTYSGSFDQRGAPYARVLDGDGNGSVIVDMGAFEKQTTSNNVPPVADAGPDQETDVDTPVTLDGSGSSDLDEGPQPLMFMWQLITGPGNVQFSAPDAAVTEFTADLPGLYVIILSVDDGVDQNSDVVNVVVNRVNSRPVANVSLSENMGNTNQPILLDGSRSSDPEMDPLTFDWSVIAQPDGSQPIVEDSTAEVTSLLADLPGTYRMQLIVSDDLEQSVPVTFTIEVIEVNLPPIANVSLSQNMGAVFSLITLDGSRSSDPEGEQLGFEWSVIDTPPGANGAVVIPTDPITTFFADTVGTYRIQLIVNDGVQNSAPVSFRMEISENLPPIANVSLSENSGAVAVPLVLDGSRSSDPEMETIGFNWSIISQPPGSSFQIADSTSAVTTVTFDTEGEYRAQLVVSDGFSNSAPVSFLINITENLAPTADVSLSQSSGVAGVPILLDGSRSSDPEDQPLTYLWSIIDQPDGSTFSLESGDVGPGQVELTVDTLGVYRAQLIVNDGFQDSAPVRFQIFVGPNEAPVANVSLSQNSGVVAVPIKLDGTRSSDPEGQPLSYLWEVIDQPAGSNAGILIPKEPTPEFTADTTGAYRVQLTVNDGFQNSAPVRFVINLEANQPPLANVSLSESSGTVGLPIRLDGSRSSDPENQPLTYRWEIITQPAGSNVQTVFFGAEGILTVDTEGEYRAQLIVNDGVQDSDPVSFLITVGPNLAPTANVGLSASSGMVESPILLDGTLSSDPENQPLTYLWEITLQPPGSVVDIENATAALTEWVADTPGLYRVQLTVSDGPNTSAPVRFLVNVADEAGNSRPLANASLSGSTGVVGLFTPLDATRSSDPDGDPLSYEWTVVLQPKGSQFGIINEFAVQTEITFDSPGLYRMQLVVSDGMLESLPVFFLIDVASPSTQPSPLGDAPNDFLLGDRDESSGVRALDAFFDELGR